MKKELLFSLKSPNRDDYEVYGFRFGNQNPSAPSIAVVGALQGSNIDQLYTASRLVDYLY